MKMRVVSKVAEKDFYGENEQAVEWQIWAALLTHLVLRYLKYKSRAQCSYFWGDGTGESAQRV